MRGPAARSLKVSMQISSLSLPKVPLTPAAMCLPTAASVLSTRCTPGVGTWQTYTEHASDAADGMPGTLSGGDTAHDGVLATRGDLDIFLTSSSTCSTRSSTKCRPLSTTLARSDGRGSQALPATDCASCGLVFSLRVLLVSLLVVGVIACDELSSSSTNQSYLYIWGCLLTERLESKQKKLAKQIETIL
jgi:hypothetical protein